MFTQKKKLKTTHVSPKSECFKEMCMYIQSKLRFKARPVVSRLPIVI